MKIKHIYTLLILLFAFSISGFSQMEDEGAGEDSMFSYGSTRSIGANSHDFGAFKGQQEYEIKIPNKGKTIMKVGRIFIPKGVGVTVIKRKAKPGEKAVILVTVNPKHVKGTFQKKLSITTHTVNQKGTKVSKTAVYGLKGQVL